MANTKFEAELEIFRTEEETAQQYFFSYLSIRSLAAADTDVLKMMNAAPLFWKTVHHATVLSAFVALGRIFDPNSRHNINTLISTAADEIKQFSRGALMARKRSDGLTHEQAVEYVADAHELTVQNLRKLRKEIAAWRGVYDERYQAIRHKVFAHRELSDINEVNRLLAKTNVEEMKRLFAFLSALYSALWELFHNGREPVLNLRPFVLPPKAGEDKLPGETVYLEGHAALLLMTAPDAD